MRSSEKALKREYKHFYKSMLVLFLLMCSMCPYLVRRRASSALALSHKWRHNRVSIHFVDIWCWRTTMRRENENIEARRKKHAYFECHVSDLLNLGPCSVLATFRTMQRLGYLSFSETRFKFRPKDQRERKNTRATCATTQQKMAQHSHRKRGAAKFIVIHAIKSAFVYYRYQTLP